jgi:hypothetical protein
MLLVLGLTAFLQLREPDLEPSKEPASSFLREAQQEQSIAGRF